MEEDISLDGQREQTLEDWVRAIKNLSESRHIIAKATKLATTNAHLASDLFAYLLRTLKKSSGDLKRRKAIFYLVDSICQVSKGMDHENSEYLLLVEKNISSIVSMVIQPDTLGADNKDVVEKVLLLWKKRDIFPPEVIEQGTAELERTASQGKRKAVSPEVEERLKEMERYRHEHKKIRRELSLRPKNEPKGAEFEEMWEKATPDRHLASLFARNNSGFESTSYGFSECSPPNGREEEPVKRGRTPSPATPSTPYSPSVPLGKFSSSSPANQHNTTGIAQPPVPQNLHPQISFQLRAPPKQSLLTTPRPPVQTPATFGTYPQASQESVSCASGDIPSLPKTSFYNPNIPTTP